MNFDNLDLRSLYCVYQQVGSALRKEENKQIKYYEQLQQEIKSTAAPERKAALVEMSETALIEREKLGKDMQLVGKKLETIAAEYVKMRREEPGAA